MEFLKTCNTNAQAIGEFEAVAYQAFSIKRNPANLPDKLEDRSISEDLYAVEAEFRQGRHLVVQDVAKSLLWFFRATTPDRAGQTPLAVPVLEGYIFEAEQSGVVKAAELSRPPIRNQNPQTPTSATLNSPLASAQFKGPQTAGQRPISAISQTSQGPEQQSQHDISIIYELFMSAVIALLSYRLVKDHSAIALNYRTFLIEGLDKRESHASSTSLWLTNMSVYWTSAGPLVISASASPRQDLRRLDQVGGEDIQKALVGRCVRVAPSGVLAKIVSLETPADSMASDIEQRLQRKRVKIVPLDQRVERWKSLVKRWLGWKGYSFSNLEHNKSWVKIRLAQVTKSQMPGSGPLFRLQSREVLWPISLCLVYDPPDSKPSLGVQDASRSPEPPVRWFESSDSTGFQDPLDTAQHWFLNKPERDKEIEARRKARRAEEEAAHVKEEHGTLYPSSPLYSRTSAYGDLQAPSGVYPTPPDGVAASGPATSNSANPTILGTAIGSDRVLAPVGNHPAVNISAPPDNGTVDGRHQSVTSPEGPMAFDHFNMTLNNENDDLFEDMDEDVMEGINVTDADFNFFDGPDGEDFAMLDVEEPRQIKQEPEPLKEKEVSSPVEPKVKMESSDEKSIAGITTQPTVPVIGYRTTESDHDNDKQELMQVEVDRAPPPSTMPPENMARAPDTTTEPSPPLDPVSIQKRLLPSPKEKLDPETPHRQTVTSHRDSIFDPVSFSRKLSLSDAKYHGSRFSFPLDRLKGVPDAFKNLSKVPTNPRNFPLLAKLRTAISTSLTHSQQDMLGIDDGDLTDSSSDIFSQEEDEGENESICPEPPSTNLILPGKRKFPVPGNATPLSSVSIAESVGPENLDISGLQTEDSCLNWFEPNPWDWSLTDLPPPSEISAPVSRKDIPSFSPVITSLPNTPTSQPEMTVEPPEERSTLSGKDSIAVAQIVTDQIVSTTLDLFNEDITASRSLDLAKVQEAWGRNSAESKLRSVIKTVFPKAIDCNVVKLASLPDVFSDNPPSANKNQPRPQPRRQVDGSASPGAHIYPIPPPYIRVRRSDALWDLLPPALSFWEPLGLAPCSGPKNVVPFCIYPHSEAIRPCLESFLVSIQIAYESCRLGNHSRMETVPEFHGGLVPCRMHQVSSSRTVFKTLRDVCIQLGKLLGGRHSQMREKDETQKIDAFVIYMVDTFQTPSSLWEMCSAFWTLFQAYQGPQGRADFFPKPDLVLQILPINYIASFEVPTILDSSVYIGLAREIYDRCPPSAPSEDRSPLSIYSAPAFQLEESLPKTIQFKFVNEPPQDILRESSYMHVGYAISLDGMWITAAWSDNCGKSQTVVSYHVGNRSFAEVAKEMWQTTGEILQSRRVTWRICLAKAGVMDRDEFDAWVSLVQCPAKLNLFVTLLTVDTAPDLRLVPTIPAGPLANPSTTHFSTNTPGSTPQAGVSPEQPGLTPAATPSENTSNPSNDPDSRLVEVTDETWAVILAHRLHNTNATVEFRPALLSGFLVKRGETYSSSLSNSLQQRDRERGPLAVGVNILYVGSVGSTRATPSPFPSSGSSEGVSPGGMGTPGPPERTPPSLTWVSTPQTRAAVENLMKEILGQFRGLGLLARLKGMQGSRYGTIPWHVAAAVRGVRGVSRCA